MQSTGAQGVSGPTPRVSIGVPVYNGEATLARTLDSLLAQSFADFELIISDNASSDGTAAICESYARRDSRIRYFRQPANIGGAPNFRFVLDQAQAPYFLWAACDDLRSPDFLEENLRVLEANPDCVAATSPNCFEGREADGDNLVSFSMGSGDAPQRFEQFFRHCWKSHGIFYSITRTAVLRQCELIGESFIAADWAIDLFLASRGKIHRTQKGLTVFGLHGVSSRPGSYRAFRNQPIELLLPFYRLSRYTLGLAAGFPPGARLRLLLTLARLNLHAAYDQAFSALYQFYCRHLRPLLKRTRTS